MTTLLTPVRDEAWFDRQWRAARRSVEFVASRFAPCGEADDCVALTMARCWNSRASYQDGKSFTGWACRTAQRIGMDLKRRNDARVSPVSLDFDQGGGRYGDQFAAPSDMVADYETFEFLESVAVAVENLPASQRVAIVPYLLGQTGKEIAEDLGIEPVTVRTRIHRARPVLAQAVAA